jgi:uncharacterized protein with NRDE domain
LVIAYSRVVPGTPLLIAANRDELRARPALAMDVLRDHDPRVLGGRDLVAGGTWLAVNEWGVVAALTNGRSTFSAGVARDPMRPSRGQIPLRLARHRTARDAVAELEQQVRSDAYAACFVLVGDRESLHYIAIGEGNLPVVRDLPPGAHVLENRPLEAVSPKAGFVRKRLPDATKPRALHQLWALLQNRTLPPMAGATARSRPPESEAAFVELGPYGTRWSGIVAIPKAGLPRFLYEEQPPGDAGPRCAPW